MYSGRLADRPFAITVCRCCFRSLNHKLNTITKKSCYSFNRRLVLLLAKLCGESKQKCECLNFNLSTCFHILLCVRRHAAAVFKTNRERASFILCFLTNINPWNPLVPWKNWKPPSDIHAHTLSYN